MTVVQTWGGDAMPDGVVIGPATESSYFCTRERAEEIDSRLRRHVGQMIGEAVTVVAVLHEARAANVHLLRGFETWHDYVADVFQDLRELRLNGSPDAIAERRALHTSMADAGIRVRSIRERTGYSLGTVHGDLVSSGRAQHRQVVDLDEAREPEPEPIKHLPKPDQVRILVGRQGNRGMTCLELEHETGWRHGVASGPFSTAARRVWVRPTGRFRDGYGVYVAP